MASTRFFGGWQKEKTACPSGHPYDEQNTRHKYGWRFCLACQKDRRASKRIGGTA